MKFMGILSSIISYSTPICWHTKVHIKQMAVLAPQNLTLIFSAAFPLHMNKNKMPTLKDLTLGVHISTYSY